MDKEIEEQYKEMIRKCERIIKLQGETIKGLESEIKLLMDGIREIGRDIRQIRIQQ